MGNAIGQSLRGNPEEDARIQAEQAAEAKRQAEIQDRQNEEARNRLMGNGGTSSGLALMGVEGTSKLQLMTGNESVGPRAGTNTPNNAAALVKHSEAFNQGLQDASQCYSQNAGPRCASMTGDQWQVCLSDYRSGYQVGDKQHQQMMDEAARAGLSAGAGGLLADPASDPRALDPCRTQWIEAYNRGYFQGKHVSNVH